MISKSDWDDVQQEMIAEDRQRLGDPPNVEEVKAYLRGELSAEEESRVRELLVCYPDLALALTQEFPSQDAKPGDPDFLSEAELDKQWASLENRIHRTGDPVEPRVLRFWHRTAATLAATLVLAFGGLLWLAQSRARMAKELAEPRVASEEQLLLPDGQRGGSGGSATLSAEGDFFLLVVPLIVPSNDAGRFAHDRLQIVDVSTNPPRSLWNSAALPRRDHDTFAVLVPRAFLRPGKYQVVLYGIDGAGEERLASYSLRVPAR
jgi:hypothetical protein